jgi:hypothetical protein
VFGETRYHDAFILRTPQMPHKIVGGLRFRTVVRHPEPRQAAWISGVDITDAAKHQNNSPTHALRTKHKHEHELLNRIGTANVCNEDDNTAKNLKILTAMVMKSSIFWDITPCSPLKVNRHFGGTYRLHRQGRSLLM